jgi:hypothetical protein
MGNNTTVIDLSIEPADLSEILQNWVLQSKFSIHKKTKNQTIYSRNFLIIKAWLLVETNEKNARLEAWISPPGVGPEFSGNFWIGWKMPVPKNYGLGPQSLFKEQFDLLLALLADKSNNILVSQSRQHENKPKPTLKKSILVTGLAAYGAINLAVGLLGVLAAKLFLSTYHSASAEAMLLDSLFNIIFGVLILISAWVLVQGKVLAVWLYGAGILLASVYSITMKHGLNYFFIGLALLFIWQMLRLKNEWELA